VDGDDLEIARGGQATEGAPAGLDLALAGQEHEDVAVIVAGGLGDGVGHPELEVLPGRGRRLAPVAHGDRVLSPLRLHHTRAEAPRDGGRLERGGREHERERRLLAALAERRDGEIDLPATLVHLVDEHTGERPR
jgi:hypothetical protein